MVKNKNSNKPEKQASKAGRQPSEKRMKHKTAKSADHMTHIPFRLREIMRSTKQLKGGSSKSQKLKKPIFPRNKPEKSKYVDIPVPVFKRKRTESEKAYIRRMENETKHVFFLTKNQVERKPELGAEKQERPADKGKSEKKKEYDRARLEKERQKKMDKQEDNMEKEIFSDNVPFGEVAMAPPCLTSKPKKAASKPQKQVKELLLNSLLGHTAPSTANRSMARQRIIEEERERAVQAYRHLKKQKQEQHQAKTASMEKVKNLE